MYKNGDYKRYYREDSLMIYGFFSEYRFLSNFHECDVMYDGYIWPSSEHAYMVAKCKNVNHYASRGGVIYDKNNKFDISCMKCTEVKKWGQTVDLREDWEDVKLNIMYQVCLDKFTRNPELRQKLLDTGDKILIEANSWGDQFWGFDVDATKGENFLGKILMKIRERIK